MKSLRVRVAAVGLLVAVFGGSAQAAPLFFNWSLNFISGPLNGQKAGGTLSVDGNDCPGGVCNGNFNPDSVAKTLLSLNISVSGINFALANDTGFGSGFPDVTFTNGLLTGVDYQGVVSGAPLAPFAVLDTSGANVGEVVAFYLSNTAIPGTPRAGSLSTGILRAPEPGTVPLLGAALIGVVLAWRRRVSQTQNQPGLPA
jgi:hypothetical protein